MTSLSLSRLSRAAFAGAALCSGIAFAQDAKLDWTPQFGSGYYNLRNLRWK